MFTIFLELALLLVGNSILDQVSRQNPLQWIFNDVRLVPSKSSFFTNILFLQYEFFKEILMVYSIY